MRSERDIGPKVMRHFMRIMGKGSLRSRITRSALNLNFGAQNLNYSGKKFGAIIFL